MTCQYSSQCSSYGSQCDDQNYRDQCREMSRHFERPDRQVFSPAAAAIIFNKVVSLHGQQQKTPNSVMTSNGQRIFYVKSDHPIEDNVADTLEVLATAKSSSLDSSETLFVGSLI